MLPIIGRRISISHLLHFLLLLPLLAALALPTAANADSVLHGITPDVVII